MTGQLGVGDAIRAALTTYPLGFDGSGRVLYMKDSRGRDTAAVIRDGRALVQAGAGLVADSDPGREDEECRNKAAAVLRAIAVANSMRPLVGAPQ